MVTLAERFRAHATECAERAATYDACGYEVLAGIDRAASATWQKAAEMAEAEAKSQAAQRVGWNCDHCGAGGRPRAWGSHGTFCSNQCASDAAALKAERSSKIHLSDDEA